MTSAFKNTMHNAAPHPIVSAARFRGPNTRESTPWLHSGANRTSQTPQCSLGSSVLPKIGFDPLTHGPFI